MKNWSSSGQMMDLLVAIILCSWNSTGRNVREQYLKLKTGVDDKY